MNRQLTAAAPLALVLVLATATSARAVDVGAEGNRETIDVIAREVVEDERAASGQSPDVRLREYRRMAECDPLAVGVQIDGSVCVPLSAGSDLSTPPGCDGLDPLLPVWRRTRTSPTAPWGPWENVLGWTCPQDYLTFTAEDFRRLPLTPAPLHTQPPGGQHLVNLPTIAYTTATTQTLTTDLLGHPIEVQATPTTYTWDFGDGTVLTTTHPGAPYPHHDITHTYPRTGTWTITLTTTWTGHYRLTGTTTWHPITGTATTTTTAPPLTTVELRTYLVPTDCTTNPHAYAC